MNKSQMIALYHQDQRIDIEYPDMRKEVTPDKVRHIFTSGAGEGRIIYSRLNETNAGDIIGEQVGFLITSGKVSNGKIKILWVHHR